MIDIVKAQRKFHTENLKQIKENVCINYNERLNTYTIYTLYDDGRLTDQYVNGEYVNFMSNFEKL